LEREGLIVGSWEPPPGGGPSKKVYIITDAGRAELARRTRSWREFSEAIERVLHAGGEPYVQPA